MKPRLYKQNPDGARVEDKGKENTAVETASIQTKPELRGVEDKGNSNYVILFIYPLQSAEADIVCIAAVSTAVFSFILTFFSKIVNFTDNYRSGRTALM